MIKVLIKKHKAKPFQTEDGEVEYHWYDAVRLSDNLLFQFGSRDGGHAVGEEKELDLVKYERGDGKFGWKELTEE